MTPKGLRGILFSIVTMNDNLNPSMSKSTGTMDSHTLNQN